MFIMKFGNVLPLLRLGSSLLLHSDALFAAYYSRSLTCGFSADTTEPFARVLSCHDFSCSIDHASMTENFYSYFSGLLKNVKIVHDRFLRSPNFCSS